MRRANLKSIDFNNNMIISNMTMWVIVFLTWCVLGFIYFCLYALKEFDPKYDKELRHKVKEVLDIIKNRILNERKS